MTETKKQDPIRPTDDDARATARALLDKAEYAALATLKDGHPMVTRIAIAATDAGLLTLVSDLSTHTTALRETPVVSLLIGEPGRGDPLAHPRITLYAHAEQLEKAPHRDAYLARQPKAALYFNFGDFNIIRFRITGADLNGGFGKAYRLTPADLGEPDA